MPIEFPCTYCRENIRVPDWGEGKRTQCPVCRRVLHIPARHSVRKQTIQQQAAESEFDPARRHAEDEARQRLRIPVNVCQSLLVVIMLASSICGVILLTSLLEGDNWAPSYSVSLFWISICLVQSILGVVGIYGLQQALNLRGGRWPWTGVLISITLGILYLVMLPFAIWSAVSMTRPEIADQFSNARREVKGIADAD